MPHSPRPGAAVPAAGGGPPRDAIATLAKNKKKKFAILHFLECCGGEFRRFRPASVWQLELAATLSAFITARRLSGRPDW